MNRLKIGYPDILTSTKKRKLIQQQENFTFNALCRLDNRVKVVSLSQYGRRVLLIEEAPGTGEWALI